MSLGIFPDRHRKQTPYTINGANSASHYVPLNTVNVSHEAMAQQQFAQRYHGSVPVTSVPVEPINGGSFWSRFGRAFFS